MRVACLKTADKAAHHAKSEASRQQSRAARSGADGATAPAFVDRSKRGEQLSSLVQMVQSSPQVTAQLAFNAHLAAGSAGVAQRVEGDEEELLQGKFAPVQRTGVEDEEPLQGKFAPTQRAAAETASASSPNQTGLPDNLKSGIESLSGISLDRVRVHYNSPQPAQLNAHAYAQGTEIHLAPGQEQHLPHEAWHVVQQAQGRVRPTMQMHGGVSVNDDTALEREADVMGAKAQAGVFQGGEQGAKAEIGHPVGPVQRLAMALDSVQALAERKPDFTAKEAESARTITNAFADRVRATGEDVAAPHQIATHGRTGGLARIGLTEELRLFGHGQTTEMSGDEAVQIGSYTPAALAQLLIDMGLPAAYQGEIYLSGCLTAVGPGHGFLGKFYALISQHAPGVMVRGNLGSAVTYPDGTQGVWSGIVSEEAYDRQMALFNAGVEELMVENRRLTAKFENGTFTDQDHSLLLSVKERVESIAASKAAFQRQVYDTSGAYTVTLPSGDVQASNAIRAVVSGAVTSGSDVNRVLSRLNDGNLGAAVAALNREMAPIEESTSELIERTEALSATPIRFSRPQ